MDPISLLFFAGLAAIVTDRVVRKATGRSLFETVGGAAVGLVTGVRDRFGRDASTPLFAPSLAPSGPSQSGVRSPRPTRPGRPSGRPSGTALIDTSPSRPGTTVEPSGDPRSSRPARLGRPDRTTTKTVTKTVVRNWTVKFVRPRHVPPAGRPTPGDGTPPSVPGVRPEETPPHPAGPHTPTDPSVTAPDPVHEPVPGGGANGAPSPPGTPNQPDPTTDPTVPGGPSGTPDPNPTEEPVTAQPIAPPHTVTEDVPAHIAAGLDLADAVEDVVEQFAHTITERIRAHIGSAESIPGFPPSLQAAWEDDVASKVEQAWALLTSAAEGARVAANRERDELSPLVEAASGAPSDAGGLQVQTLRAQ